MKGKQRCKILKEIRRQIAENNDIEYITSECKHQGDCAGTCPKCESEVRYLERELEKRARLGKAVTVAGLAVTITATTMSTTSCDLFSVQTAGDMLPPEEYTEKDGMIAPPDDALEGDLDIEVTAGEMPPEDDQTELGGDPLPDAAFALSDLPPLQDMAEDYDHVGNVLPSDLREWLSDVDPLLHRGLILEVWGEYFYKSTENEDFYALHVTEEGSELSVLCLVVTFGDEGFVSLAIQTEQDKTWFSDDGVEGEIVVPRGAWD